MKLFRTKVIVPLSILILIPASQFVFNTKYSFPEPQPFSGSYLYNPYHGMDSTKWKIANFHAHTRCYAGLTDGSSNFDQSLDSYYRSLDYNIIGISNYQTIDRYESANKWFIPVYEHGYQYFKNHQLVINAKKVSWLDFFFRQTLSNKQAVINKLKKNQQSIVTLVHPVKRGAYSLKDLKYLANYDCLEIANNEGLFTMYYDTILSSGHPVFLMANDDAHDLSKPNNGCHSYNIINSDLNKDSILHAIRKGCLIGVDMSTGPGISIEGKKSEIRNLPEITNVALKNDTLTVSLNKPVKTFKFIGQDGIVKKSAHYARSCSYFISGQDTYIRTEIECLDGSRFFLNPVFRYNGTLTSAKLPAPDLFSTWSIRIFVSAFLLYLIIRRMVKHYKSGSKLQIELYSKLKKSA